MTNCSKCGATVSDHEPTCECGELIGYPNVRKARAPDELEALNKRVQDAINTATSLGSFGPLQQFSDAVDSDSVAVVARDLGTLDALSRSENSYYISYHRQVRSGARTPQENDWDRVRNQVDEALFANYSDNIIFASLALDDVGDTHYGQIFVTLKNAMIAARASVFESNSLEFARSREFRLAATIPPGHRAEWAARNNLAVAKLHQQITPTTVEAEFPGILFNTAGAEADFIEVHVFGRIGLNSISRVTGVTPMTTEDKALWNVVKRRLATRGVTVQER